MGGVEWTGVEPTKHQLTGYERHAKNRIDYRGGYQRENKFIVRPGRQILLPVAG
jgi:hypothetical protein